MIENEKELDFIPDNFEFNDEDSDEYSPEIEVIEEEEKEYDFNENLAENLEKSQKTKIVSFLLEGIQKDINSREEWEDTIATGISLLALNSNKKNLDELLNKVTDPLMLKAFLSFLSNRTEMYPEDGISDYEVDGEETEELTNGSEKRVLWLNYYLKIGDKDYLTDCETADSYIAIVGTGFKKVYRDPVTNFPISRSIDPFNIFLDNSVQIFKQCERITEIEYLTKNEIELRENNGFYIKSETELSDNGDDFNNLDDKPIILKIREINGINSVYDKNTTHRYLTCSCILYNEFLLELENENGNGGLPYIAHICAQTNELVGLYRNWDENANNYSRKNYYVLRKFLPGFGIYGIGLSHLLANPTTALSIMTRLMMDVEKYNQVPGGFIAEGRRLDHPSMQVGPAMYYPISTMGMPISDSIIPFPSKSASPVLKDLISEWRSQWQAIDMGIESKIAENSGNVPVGTTMAMIESQSKVHSMIIKSLLNGFGEELRLIDQLFKESFSEKPYVFYSKNKKYELSQNDYFDNVTIIPACDSNISSSTHKIILNDAIIRMMETAPELYVKREAHRRWLKANKVPDIDSLLVPEEQIIPLDPLTESFNALQGKALKVAEWQDHDSHLIAHQESMQSNEFQQNPNAIKIMYEHYNTHLANKFYIEIKNELNIPLPPLEQLKIPEIQNEIAKRIVPILQERQKAAAKEKPIDPTSVMMMDVQQKEKASELKAEIDKMKLEFEAYKIEKQTELEAYKAQLQFEQSKEKIEAEMEIAEEDNETKLELEKMKQGEI